MTPAVQPVQTAFCYTPAPREERTDIQRLLQRMAADDSRALLIYSYLEHELLDGHACLVPAQSLAILERLFALAQRAGHPAAYISGASKKQTAPRPSQACARARYAACSPPISWQRRGWTSPARTGCFWPVPCGTALSYSKAPDVSCARDGQGDALIYDFVDRAVPSARSQHTARRRVYRALKCSIRPDFNIKEKE